MGFFFSSLFWSELSSTESKRNMFYITHTKKLPSLNLIPDYPGKVCNNCEYVSDVISLQKKKKVDSED